MKKYSETYNDAKTLETSNSDVVDLFFLIGASRNKDIRKSFDKALKQNEDLAMRVLAWSRDIRQGAGERQIMRNLCLHLEKNYPDLLEKLIPHLPNYGRWDDLLIFETKRFQNQAAKLVWSALDKNDGLCAKWMPRKGKTASYLRNFRNMKEREWRKMLAQKSDTVEQKICAKDFSAIDYNQVPSIAIKKYSEKVFSKYDHKRYSDWLDSLGKSSSAKINADAIFPHDILKPVIDRFGYSETDLKRIQAQWDALSNHMGNGGAKILPMADVSGSMMSGLSGNLCPLDISISLSYYCANKQQGPFNNIILSFTSTPSLFRVNGKCVEEDVDIISRNSMGYSTNIDGAMKCILDHAIQNNVPKEDMPDILLILSDMEFDSCGNMTIFDKTVERFKDSGYNVPQIVFWNLNGRPGNVPVDYKQKGVALISGFSPNILKSIMHGKLKTPEEIMMDTIMVDRYNILT